MMNWYKWVDPRVKQVRAAQARAYMEQHGWKLKPSLRPESLMYEGPRADDGKPILQIVPVSEDFVDYGLSITYLITNLAVIEDRLAVDVLNDMLQIADDMPASNGAPPKRTRRARTARR